MRIRLIAIRRQRFPTWPGAEYEAFEASLEAYHARVERTDFAKERVPSSLHLDAQTTCRGGLSTAKRLLATAPRPYSRLTGPFARCSFKQALLKRPVAVRLLWVEAV